MTYWEAFRETAKQAGIGALIGVPFAVFLFVFYQLLSTDHYVVLVAFVVVGAIVVMAITAWFHQRSMNRNARDRRDEVR